MNQCETERECRFEPWCRINGKCHWQVGTGRNPASEANDAKDAALTEFVALSEPARLALVGASIGIEVGSHARAAIEHNPDQWLCFRFNTWDEVMAALRAVKAWDSAGYRAKDAARREPLSREVLEAAAVALEEKAWEDGLCVDPDADEAANTIRAAMSIHQPKESGNGAVDVDVPVEGKKE